MFSVNGLLSSLKYCNCPSPLMKTGIICAFRPFLLLELLLLIININELDLIRRESKEMFVTGRIVPKCSVT